MFNETMKLMQSLSMLGLDSFIVTSDGLNFHAHCIFESRTFSGRGATLDLAFTAMFNLVNYYVNCKSTTLTE